jgi:dihydropteroate synthase
MRGVGELLDLGRPVLVGPSRKRFIGAILDLPEDERVEGTIGAVVWMVGRDAHIVRVHDVREVVRAVRVADAIARAG